MSTNVVQLINQSSDGTPLEVTYIPELGMNMISFKKGGLETIDQSTKNLFEERFAGLGALIGPHFHHRRKEIISKIKDESLFPHIARIRAKGIEEPFSHGIARYAPWKIESATKNSVKATLTGKDTWNDVPLAELEGQNFKMIYSAELNPDGLQIDMSIVSDTDSLVGIHYYWHLPDGKGEILAQVQNAYIEGGERKSIPENWTDKDKFTMSLPLDKSTDFTFYPYPDPLAGKIILKTSSHKVILNYNSISQENCWQLYHPEGSTFVCIEPLSAQDPRHPNLSVSSIRIHINIENN